jgi:ubiquinone/menaquinone biosynthesis C-methylase UbiE
MFHIDDVLNTFTAKSGQWGEKNKYIAGKVGETRRLIKLLPDFVKPGMRVLDLGSGIGKISNELAALNKNLEIFAADLSFPMASKIFARSGQGINRVYLTDAQNICFIDNFFDVIVAQQVFHHIPNPVRALQETFRILKPGGVLLILTVGNDYQHEIFPCEDCCMTNDPLGRIHAEELKEMVKKVGFSVATVANDFFKLQFENVDTYYKFMNSIGAVDKIFQYRAPKSNGAKKEMIYQRVFASKKISKKTPFLVKGHYITLVARKLI